MEKEKLLDYMNIIFSNENNILSSFKNTWNFYKQDNVMKIKYDHSSTLVDIYSNIQSDTESIQTFLEAIEYQIRTVHDKFVTKEEPGSLGFYPSTRKIAHVTSSIPLCFYTLIQIGKKEMAFYLLEEKLNIENSLHLALFLVNSYKYDINFFNISEARKFIELFSNHLTNENGEEIELIKNLIALISEKAFLQITSEIKGVNIEINRDKESVKNFLVEFGFTDNYILLINEIDKYTLSNDKLLSSGMIGNLRSFMEGFIKDLSRKIASKCKEEIPINKELGEMGNIRKYLMIKLELTEKDNSFINKYIDILHAEGGHSFVSNSEYFRLSKNIGIEIVLLLLFKYKKLITD